MAVEPMTRPPKAGLSHTGIHLRLKSRSNTAADRITKMPIPLTSKAKTIKAA